MSLARREVKNISHVIRVNVIPSGDVMIGLLDNIKSDGRGLVEQLSKKCHKLFLLWSLSTCFFDHDLQIFFNISFC